MFHCHSTESVGIFYILTNERRGGIREYEISEQRPAVAVLTISTHAAAAFNNPKCLHVQTVVAYAVGMLRQSSGLQNSV